MIRIDFAGQLRAKQGIGCIFGIPLEDPDPVAQDACRFGSGGWFVRLYGNTGKIDVAQFITEDGFLRAVRLKG